MWKGLVGSITLSALLASGSCTSTNNTNGAPSASISGASEVKDVPSIRLYLLSNVAGALEPCGCSKDQLGGADHFAALLGKERESAKTRMIVGAGPLFFQDPVLPKDGATQAQWKAEALAQVSKRVGVAAWGLSANDFAAGTDALKKLQQSSGISFVAANLQGDPALVSSSVMKDASGVLVGIVGVAEPAGGLQASGAAVDALKKETAALRAKGARIVVALAAMNRGEALRLVDAIPDLDVLVVGAASQTGDHNDAPKSPQLLGDTIVVETSNHLQTVAVLDLYLHEKDGSAGRIKLADGGGLTRAEEDLSLGRQIRDLETRINGWEKDKNVNKVDLDARRKELEKLRRQKSDLALVNEAPPQGSFFKYTLVEVREKLGEDADVGADILSYYKRVNEHNRVAFKDRVPQAPSEGQPSYIGIEKCSSCHQEEKAVWDKTAHAKAYPTLQKKFVEYNLDCVGCHVTGYDRPGGSTVTHTAQLENVQCETCHGPGSLHAADPTKKGLVLQKPEPKSCVSECHHSPHVEGFDAAAKTLLILGPGHGR